jgi:hypothetical protein
MEFEMRSKKFAQKTKKFEISNTEWCDHNQKLNADER